MGPALHASKSRLWVAAALHRNLPQAWGDCARRQSVQAVHSTFRGTEGYHPLANPKTHTFGFAHKCVRDLQATANASVTASELLQRRRQHARASRRAGAEAAAHPLRPRAPYAVSIRRPTQGAAICGSCSGARGRVALAPNCSYTHRTEAPQVLVAGAGITCVAAQPWAGQELAQCRLSHTAAALSARQRWSA